MDVVLARSACSGRALRESVSTDDLSERYGQPYAERGHVCVRCMVLCVGLRVPGGRRVTALAIVLAVIGGLFQAPKKSILSTETFLADFGPSAVQRVAIVHRRVVPLAKQRPTLRRREERDGRG